MVIVHLFSSETNNMENQIQSAVFACNGNKVFHMSM